MRILLRAAIALLGWHWTLGIGLRVEPLAAEPAQTTVALVIGETAYAHQPEISACREAAINVADRLRRQGSDVTPAIDATAAVLRGAIDSFAAKVRQKSGARRLVYFCGAVANDGSRLFLLPADTDVQRPADLLTQAVLVKALTNALSGSNGLLVGELYVRPGADLTAAFAAIGRETPERVHVALTAASGRAENSLAQVIEAASPDAGQGVGEDWTQFTTAVQGRLSGSDSSVAVLFVPPAKTPAPVDGSVVAMPPPPLSGNVTPAPPSESAGERTEAAPMVASITPPLALPSPARPSPAHRRPALAQNARNVRIKAALAGRGFYAGSAEGSPDARMQAAIRAYQRSLGVGATGKLTATELAILMNAP